MAATEHESESNAAPATPGAAPSRGIRLVRVAVLLLSALAIVFTATLHENLGFDRVVIAMTTAALALVLLVEWFVRGPRRNPALLLQAIAALGATIGVALAGEAVLVAVVIAAWALVTALLDFVAATLGLAERGEGTVLGALGLLLALAVLLVREDPVATIGFFGVYVLIAGVYLGIAAFDQRTARTADQAEAAARA